MLKDFFNNYFGFNRQQRNGLFVLMSISFLLLIIRIVYPYFIIPDDIEVVNLRMKARQLDSMTKSTEVQFRSKVDKESPISNSFNFNPNTVSYKELLLFGFSKKSANALLKYRNKGFVFRKKEDLKKVYGVNEKLFEKISPFIILENNSETNVKVRKNESENSDKISPTLKQKKEDKKKLVLELNTTDSLALLDVEGIGPVYAKRILKFRNQLGGFYSVAQLKEVYGFANELFQKVESDFKVDTTKIIKINLNKEKFKVLNKHPYISYELSKKICDWRKKTNLNFTNLKQIVDNDSLFYKLCPYVIFE